MTASTSIGFECPRAPVSLGLESRISQTELSLHVRHDLPNVRKRFELRTTYFSSSSGTNDSGPTSLISSSNFSFIFFSQRDTQDSQRSIPAWSSRREHRPGEMIVRRRFRFLPPVVGSYRFCSLRHASNGFFRELGTMSFAS